MNTLVSVLSILGFSTGVAALVVSATSARRLNQVVASTERADNLTMSEATAGLDRAIRLPGDKRDKRDPRQPGDERDERDERQPGDPRDEADR